MGDVIPFKRRSKAQPFNPPPRAVKAARIAEKFLRRHDELMLQAREEATKLGLHNRPANVHLLHLPEPVKHPYLRALYYRDLAMLLCDYAFALAGLPPIGAA